jgi:hypothetical protein
MQITVTISDVDREVDYTLAVVCDFLAGSAPRAGWLDGGEPGEAPAVEISRVRCLAISLWCGPYAVPAVPGAGAGQSLERPVGDWCLARYCEEIEAAVLEKCLARRDRVIDDV